VPDWLERSLTAEITLLVVVRRESYCTCSTYVTLYQVSKLHTVYWEVSGKEGGLPVVVLHGGPGGGSQPEYRCVYSRALQMCICRAKQNWSCSLHKKISWVEKQARGARRSSWFFMSSASCWDSHSFASLNQNLTTLNVNL
jgi:hypothetical protein